MSGITGETRVLAVIGHPVSHSLSPQIHNSFARGLDLPYAYVAFDVEAGNLEAFADAARLLNFAGFNVTMPLKEAILPYLDIIDDDAAQYGAVNTVVNRNGALHGYNTDGGGFVLSLKENGFDTARGKALILGAGGAAKAVALALCGSGMRVCIASRREQAQFNRPGISYCGWNEMENEAAGCSLLVNATPLGMNGSGQDFEDCPFLNALNPDAIVYDLIYHPRETKLMRIAVEKGFRSMNGLSHLVRQAALSFALFTGTMPSEESIANAYKELL